MQEGNLLHLETSHNGQKTSTVQSYDRKQVHWRFRHSVALNTLLWETSADGANWNVVHAATPTLPLSSVTIEMSAGTEQPAAEGGVSIFDDFTWVREGGA